MRVNENNLLQEVHRREGLPPLVLGPPAEWPLHLKAATPPELSAVVVMPTVHTETHEFLVEAARYLRNETFRMLRTSRTIKPVRISRADLDAAVAHGKFERCGENVRHPFPDGVHGVNVFTVNEAKGRRRIITEPHLNTVVRKSELPEVHRLSRLERRQRQVRNSTKTITKLDLASKAERFSIRSFAVLVSLICFARHTTRINPADVFPLVRCYRALYRKVARGSSWDDEIPQISSSVREAVDHYVLMLVKKPILDDRAPY